MPRADRTSLLLTALLACSPERSPPRAPPEAPVCDPAPVVPPRVAPPSLERSPQWARVRAMLDGPADAIDPVVASACLAQARDATVDVDAVVQQVAALAERVRARLPPRCDHRCRLDVLHRVLYRDERFTAARDLGGAYRNVDRALIDRVLATRVGYCTGLSLLEQGVARRLGVPLALVIDREHAWLRYVGGEVAPFDLDPTRQGAPPAPVTDPCPRPASYGRALSPRESVGVALSVAGLDSGMLARPWLEAAAELLPGDPDLHNNLALERRRHGDLPGALASFEAARRLDPCATLLATNTARALYAIGRREESRALLDAAEARAQRREDHVFAQLTRAAFALEEGRDDEAERTLLDALARSQGASDVLEALAGLHRAQGRRDDALRDMQAAVLTDDTPRTRLGLAAALRDLGRTTEAWDELTRLHRAGASPGSISLPVARVAALRGDADETLRAARDCLGRVGERCADALVALGDLARVRGDAACARRYYEAWLAYRPPESSRARRVSEAEVRASLGSLPR